MAVFNKPDNLNNVWASGGDKIYPGDTKYATGWQVEIPPRQYFNQIDYKQDQMLAHLNQFGIPVWDNETEYQEQKSYVQGATGTVYRCVQTHGGTVSASQNPDTDSANDYWVIAFASSGDFYTKTDADARYARLSLNGSDYNPATFRSNISVYSKAESYTKTEVDSKTTIATAAQAAAQTSNTVLLTPFRVADVFRSSNQFLAENGYQKLPGGLVMQWCSGEISVASAVGSVSTLSLSFPLAFTTILNIQLSQDLGKNVGPAGEEAAEVTFGVATRSLSGITVRIIRRSGHDVGGETVKISALILGTI